MKALFVHVPRCGGMSFYYFLEEIFGARNSIRFGDSANVDLFLNAESGFSNYHCLSGHIPYNEFKNRGGHNERFTIAFVRDPLERELSSYNNIHMNDYEDHADLRCASQAAYWDKFAHTPELHNLQTAYFSPTRRFEDASVAILENRICVFDIADMPLVVQVIKDFLKVSFHPQKTNGAPDDQKTLDEMGREHVIELCREDFSLHAWVKENFDFFRNLLKAELWRSYLIGRSRGPLRSRESTDMS